MSGQDKSDTMLDALVPTAASRNEEAMYRAKEVMKTPLPKRFYKVVEIDSVNDESGAVFHRVLLDGRPIRSPAKNVVAVPAVAIAEALAAEWDAQEREVNPATMPVTRLVNSTIDGVEQARDAMLDEIVSYLNNDFLCYPAAHPQRLVDRQRDLWHPVLDWAEAALGGRFVQASGILAVEQSPVMGDRLRELWQNLDIFQLAAVHSIMTLTGSTLLSAALWHGALDQDSVWKAAMVDEDWNIEMWGEDEEATKRRDFRRSDFDAAALILAALRSEND